MSRSPSPDVDRMLSHSVSTGGALEAVLGAAHPLIVDKHTDFTTPLIREFITMSKFFVLATADADGLCDSSPRGDIVSTILFPDDHTLVLPDRPGNRRADSYRNIISNPHVGILFLVPGIDEIVRVNGRATITVDSEALQAMSIGTKPAQLGLVVQVDEVYVHCARAVLRSKMFETDTWPNADDVPTLRDMMNEQHAVADQSAEPKRQEEYRSVLY